ncbi:FAD-dependent monooxygenase [Mycobacterium gastri]|uniref:FAD-dependent oxidoreductase n=1 Tax=Mycobacterium gastri TaxID=1777 RepID=A0A1X1VBJ4_MYCGS|nr:FAD-dependent monooxygenase [Mycobacterium gastri]ETW26561.1 FAD-dependent oxidoreductase [Mycobacterium gastri 'Wayne']ORV66412.1 FAD-dependent oxidoreductase [Mycobacterium gastri]
MKVLVCGAGVAGLTLAERLAALGAEVVLLERESGPRARGHVIDFYGAGYEAAEAIGVLPAIQGVAYPVGEASVVDQHGRRKAAIPYRQIVKALDGRLCRVLRPDLETVLRDNLPPKVDLRFGATVSEVAQCDERVTVTLNGGAQLDADLLVGADGIHSTVRALVFGPEERYLHHRGLRCAAFLLDPPSIGGVAGDHVILTDTVDRQLGLQVLRDGRTAVSAVYRASDAKLPRDARTAFRDKYAGMGGWVTEVLDRCPESEEVDDNRVAQLELPRWSSKRVVLIGDACFAVSMLIGQGASLAVASAYVLAEQLRNTSSVERALSFYERLWRPVVEEKQASGRAASGWLWPASSQSAIRRATLRLTWRPLVNRFVETTLAGEPTAVIPMLRLGQPERD